MTAFARFCHALVLPVAALFLASIILPTAATAAMVTTDEVIAEESAASDRVLVMEFMAREDVRQQIVDWGVDPVEAEKRVSALSNAELARIAEHIKAEPAGQSAIGAIVGAALIIFIILLITDIVGVTDVFSFVKK